MIWEVFRQEKAGGYHTHCGNVHAPDREMAELFAQIQHGRRMKTHSLWVVPQGEISEVDDERAHFGGTTDKAYRWAMTYNRVDGSFAREVAESEAEQREAARKRKEAQS
ncbi:1,2-phenylacetyl-CoA epoxidase subunit PaaB [Halegenticoccus soli]|uniref:1,2-phenylacetyl-CoA epoxidase subunit PaaB n=1 Tax=Halegenticoccus soli TaxID=1985678 RepID=UPI000C6E4E4B|nr:1,2-phenylacetyl-CoA epoxidase subunit PaaB [Halegenticoccus soli]